MTVYEFNQANYANAPTMDDEALKKSIPYVASFLSKHKSNYYMMLEKDQRYYTLFTFANNSFNPTKMAKEIIEVAKSLGSVKSIEESSTNSGMLEIWITPGLSKECRMYGVFDYTIGVIEV